MDIYQFFACRRELPVKIDDVVGFIKDRHGVEHIFFSDVELDPDILWAQLRVSQYIKAYGESYVYEIQYSQSLTHAQERLACCKEVLHVLDEEASKASTQEEVELLIKQMTIPPQMGISLPAEDDHTGLLRALMILVPRDCLSKFKPAYDTGKISAEEVALTTGIPVEYARLALSDMWVDLVKKIG